VRRTLFCGSSSPVLLLPCFSQAQIEALGKMRGGVINKTENGELAVLPHAHIVLRGPTTKETESDAQGAFAIDSLPPGMYDVEASAPGLYAALAVEVSGSRFSAAPVKTNLAAVTSTMSLQLTGLEATDSAFSRKVYHA